MRTLSVLALASLAPLVSAQQPDLVDALAADGNYDTLVQAVQVAGLVDALKGPGPLTVFAPDDEAFAKLPTDLLNNLLADPPALAQVLLYHVLPGDLDSGTVVSAGAQSTLLREKVVLSAKDGTAFVNAVEITDVDWVVSNGRIHTIDEVLIPGQLLPPTLDIVEGLIAAPNFDTLVTAVQTAGLVDTLKGPGPFTLFAPTDAAFAALPDGVLDSLLQDPVALSNVLLTHVVAGEVFAQDLVGLNEVATQGNSVWVNLTPLGNFVNEARLTVTDIELENGVVHVIDAVLTTPPSLATFLAGTGAFPTLVTAVETAGLVDTLSGAGPFTLFAPSERAFQGLPSGALAGLLADPPALANLLTYHVLPEKLLAADVISQNGATTVQGADLTFSVNANGFVFVDQAQVTFTDIQLPGVAIHLINAVLMPPAPGA